LCKIGQNKDRKKRTRQDGSARNPKEWGSKMHLNGRMTKMENGGTFQLLCGGFSTGTVASGLPKYVTQFIF
jgi:hypothetical protein